MEKGQSYEPDIQIYIDPQTRERKITMASTLVPDGQIPMNCRVYQAIENPSSSTAAQTANIHPLVVSINQAIATAGDEVDENTTLIIPYYGTRPKALRLQAVLNPTQIPHMSVEEMMYLYREKPIDPKYNDMYFLNTPSNERHRFKMKLYNKSGNRHNEHPKEVALEKPASLGDNDSMIQLFVFGAILSKIQNDVFQGYFDGDIANTHPAKILELLNTIHGINLETDENLVTNLLTTTAKLHSPDVQKKLREDFHLSEEQCNEFYTFLGIWMNELNALKIYPTSEENENTIENTPPIGLFSNEAEKFSLDELYLAFLTNTIFYRSLPCTLDCISQIQNEPKHFSVIALKSARTIMINRLIETMQATLPDNQAIGNLQSEVGPNYQETIKHLQNLIAAILTISNNGEGDDVSGPFFKCIESIANLQKIINAFAQNSGLWTTQPLEGYRLTNDDHHAQQLFNLLQNNDWISPISGEDLFIEIDLSHLEARSPKKGRGGWQGGGTGKKEE